MKRSSYVFLFLLFSFPLAAHPAEPTDVSGPNLDWSSSAEISNDSVFHVVSSDKISDSPVHWVTAGGGVLAFGSGRQVYFSLEEDPYTLLASLSVDHAVSEGLVLGRYAYLAQDRFGLRMFDLEDPSNPIDLGVHDLVGPASHLASWGNLLLVGDGGSVIRLFEIDLSVDRGSPDAVQTILVDRGSIPVGAPATTITVGADGKAYIAAENEVRGYDISNPSKPVEVDRFFVTPPVRSMGVNGNDLYLAAGDEGLHIVDLSIPGETSTLATHRIPSESLYLAGRRVYLASGIDGLNVLQAGPTGAATFDVQVGDSGFVPYAINIHTGDTIRWIWVAPGYPTISGTSRISSATSDFITAQGRFRSPHTFNKPGTFRYDCIPSCYGGLAGTVSVVTPLAFGNISITPASVNFGNVAIGSSSDQTITITNQSSSTGTLTGSVGTLSAPLSVVSGGGGFSLSPGQSKSIVVQLSPTAAGPFSGTLSITHDAGNQTSPINVSLSGAGVSIGISITPATVNFGNITVGASFDQTITITNTSVASVLHGTVGGLSAPFSVVSGGGVFNNVLPGQSVPVTVRFLPVAAGPSSATLTITYTEGVQNGSTDVPLSGTGVIPVSISITPATVDFGSVAIGSSSDQTITITNQSSSTGTLTGSVGTLLPPFSVVSGRGVLVLTPGQSKSVVVRFSPTTASSFSRTLSITHNAGNQTSPTNVSLSGTGTAAIINISIAPPSVNFGNVNVGQTLDQTVTITNQTSSTETLTGSVGTLSAPFSIVSGGGAYSLPAGQSKSVVVRFSPTATGPFSGTLSITHNAGNQTNPANVSLSGTGGPAPPATINISISPTSIDFGSSTVGQMFDLTLTLTNQSNSTGTLTGSVGTLSAPFSIVSGGGAFSLTPAQSKSVTVRFSPTATGPFSGTLSITHNAGNQSSPANVPLSGTGITPIPGTINISVTPPSVNFGNVALGELSDQTVTLTNQSNSAGTLTGSVGALSVPFSVVSGGGAFNLTPGQSKSVTVRFSPTATGASSGTLSITHNATNQSSPTNVPLSGTGVIRIVNLLVTPSSVEFGSVILGQTVDQTITITNQTSSTGTLTGNVGSLITPFILTSSSGAFSLSPGQSMSVTVRFFPMTAGPTSENLLITHNATNLASPQTVSLNGQGVAPTTSIKMSVSPTSVEFGSVPLGQSPDQTLTITNQADSNDTLAGSVSALSAPFSVVSGAGAFSLSPNESKAIIVRFSPTSEGASSGNLSIVHNATNQNNPTDVSLSGEGVLPTGVAISFISGPGTAKLGERIIIQNTVTNYGTPPVSNLTVNFYLSADTKIDVTDTRIGRRSITSLAPGASAGPVSTRVTIPRNVAPGSYFIGAIVRGHPNFDPKGITICLPLSKSTLLSPRNRGTNISATPTLDWSDVNGAVSYEAQVSTDSRFTNISASIAGLTNTEWNVGSALIGETTYFWRVRAVNDCGPGPWSSTWSFKTM